MLRSLNNGGCVSGDDRYTDIYSSLCNRLTDHKSGEYSDSPLELTGNRHSAEAQASFRCNVKRRPICLSMDLIRGAEVDGQESVQFSHSSLNDISKCGCRHYSTLAKLYIINVYLLLLPLLYI